MHHQMFKNTDLHSNMCILQIQFPHLSGPGVSQSTAISRDIRAIPKVALNISFREMKIRRLYGAAYVRTICFEKPNTDWSLPGLKDLNFPIC